MTIGGDEPQVPADRIVSRVEESLSRAAVEWRRLTIAHSAVDLAIESELAPFLLPPFAHLQSIANRPPDLQISVATLREEDVAAFDLGRVPDSGLVIAAGATVIHLHPDSAVVFDRGSRQMHALLRYKRGVASWQRAKPLQLPLSIFFADRGIDLVHAGLVSLRGQGVLIAGPGGSGKSTLSVASMLDGLDFLGDDCVAVSAGNGKFEGFSVYGSTALDPTHLARFPALAGVASLASRSDEKAVLPIAQHYAGGVASETTIRAIVLPRVSHGEHAVIHPASGKEALLALAPSSILKRAVPAAAALARIASMVRGLPSFRLDMGPVDEAGSRVRELLEGLSS